MKSFIFIDVDGTLLHHGDQIPQSAITAIQTARQNGHQLYLSTGRPKCELSPEIINIGFDGFVCAGGACVIDHETTLYENVISPTEVTRLLQWLEAQQIGYALQGAHKTYLNDVALSNIHAIFGLSKDSELAKVQAIQNLFTPAYEFHGQEAIYKLCFYAWQTDAQAKITEFMHDYNLIFHHSEDDMVFGEITNQGIHKSIGIQKILEYHQADQTQSVAYGDSANDMEMIEYVKLGICMGNGVDALKAIADEICLGVEEDGLYHSFKQHGFI